MEELAGWTEVLVTLTYERERGAGLCAREEVEWWTERAAEVLDVSPRARAYASPGHRLSGEVVLERRGRPRRLRPRCRRTEGVRFLLASGRRAEAELAAEQVAELIRAGFDPGGIAVVVRQVRTWGSLLDEVFASCGIPCRIDERRRLGETGLGHAFLEALRGVVLDDAEPLLSYLRGPYSGSRRGARQPIWRLATGGHRVEARGLWLLWRSGLVAAALRAGVRRRSTAGLC